MVIFKKAIPRRSFLRGVGATVALPLLDAMIPALGTSGEVASKSPARLGIVYVPNGIIMDKWTPAAEGAGYAMTPTLQPLAAFRDRFLVLSGLAQNQGRAQPGESGADHPRASGAFLTGVHTLSKGKEGELLAGVSVDQVAAKELGKRSQLASLELGLESPDVDSSCGGYSCAFNNTISWRTPTTPLPMENHPRKVFERLFGDSDSTNRAERLGQMSEDRSILDSMMQGVASLKNGLGPGDCRKLTEYLDAIRDVERRIRMAEEQPAKELPNLERPAGIPSTYREHAKLMFELQVLAYQCDLTRISSMMMAREQSTLAYPEIGIPDPHHPLTHHNGDTEKIAKVIQINLFHAQLFAHFLERMQSTPDGDGSLLDHTMILYGSSLGDGNLHLHNNLPVLLAGGASVRIKGGRHIRYADGTPMTNLFLTLLDKLGVPVDKLGDSTGELDLLSV
jgi:hypothetical protein